MGGLIYLSAQNTKKRVSFETLYDIVVEKSKHDIIRVQVKTVDTKNQVSFRGGTRGGVDRTYRSGVKSYTQDTDKSDIVVGVQSTVDRAEKRQKIELK